jgi:hypothetical protein
MAGRPDEPEHTAEGAPTDAAHEAVGDGTLIGSIPPGISPEELEEIAKSDAAVEPGGS